MFLQTEMFLLVYLLIFLWMFLQAEKVSTSVLGLHFCSCFCRWWRFGPLLSPDGLPGAAIIQILKAFPIQQKLPKWFLPENTQQVNISVYAHPWWIIDCWLNLSGFFTHFNVFFATNLLLFFLHISIVYSIFNLNATEMFIHIIWKSSK